MGSRLISEWRKWFLVAEPIAVSVAWAAFVYWSEVREGWLVVEALLSGVRLTLYAATAGLSGSLLGFVIAALAITVGSFGSTRLRPVEKHMGTLITTFTAATVYLGVSTLTSLIALVADRDSAPVPWIFYTLVLAISLSIVSVARSVWILHNVVWITGAPSKRREADE